MSGQMCAAYAHRRGSPHPCAEALCAGSRGAQVRSPELCPADRAQTPSLSAGDALSAHTHSARPSGKVAFDQAGPDESRTDPTTQLPWRRRRVTAYSPEMGENQPEIGRFSANWPGLDIAPTSANENFRALNGPAGW